MRELEPIRAYPHYWEPIVEEIARALKEAIYAPISEEMPHLDVLENAPRDLLRAIQSGQIRYAEGRFDGRFSASISKELKALGAKWKHGGFVIAHQKFTPDMRIAMAGADDKYQKMIARVTDRLDKITPSAVAEKIKLGGALDTMLGKVGKDFDRTVKSITITAKFTPEQKEKIREEYTETVKLSIVDWTKKETIRLRKAVVKSTFAGNRYEELAKTIQRSYGASRSKAKFLARQETNLLLSQYREIRYQDAGLPAYRWRCVAGSKEHPVRPIHHQLGEASKRGKIYYWSDPPIVDKMGHRKHPGEDFGCRCTAVPVVKF